MGCDRDCGPMAAPRRHWHTHWGTRRPTQSTPLCDQCPGECCLHCGRPAAVAWKSVEHGAASVSRPALLGAAAVRNRSGRERKRSRSASSETEASADGTFALESLRTTKNHSRFGPFMGTSCCTDGTRLSPHVASRRWPCRLSKRRRGAHCTGRAQFPPWHAGPSASLGA